jgi:hypothetical protein
VALSLPEQRLPPWTVIEENAACFFVKDHAGLSFGYVGYLFDDAAN